MPVQQRYHRNPPDIGVVALFPKAGANGSAFLLDHGPFVGNRFGGAHITDELLHYESLATCTPAGACIAWHTGSHRGGLKDPTGPVCE